MIALVILQIDFWTRRAFLLIVAELAYAARVAVVRAERMVQQVHNVVAHYAGSALPFEDRFGLSVDIVAAVIAVAPACEAAAEPAVYRPEHFETAAVVELVKAVLDGADIVVIQKLAQLWELVSQTAAPSCPASTARRLASDWSVSARSSHIPI